MNTAIELRNVSVVIDKKPILSDITAKIPAGKIVGLLGPSGSGKTTLIRTLLGLQKVSSGKITVLDGKPGVRTLKREIGYVTQSPSVYGDLSVGENIAYFASLVGVPKHDVRKVLEEVELQEHERAVVSKLSGGQRARVSLAIALLGKPKLLLLDEPTVGLDPVLRRSLWQHFAELASSGVTLLISSHVMDEAEKCDELLFIRDGKLLAHGTKGSILSDTRTHSMEAAFLALAERGES